MLCNLFPQYCRLWSEVFWNVKNVNWFWSWIDLDSATISTFPRGWKKGSNIILLPLAKSPYPYFVDFQSSSIFTSNHIWHLSKYFEGNAAETIWGDRESKCLFLSKLQGELDHRISKWVQIKSCTVPIYFFRYAKIDLN